MIPDWAMLAPLVMATLIFLAGCFLAARRGVIVWPFFYFAMLLCILHAELRTQQMVQRHRLDWANLEMLKLRGGK